MNKKTVLWISMAAACVSTAIAQDQPEYVHNFCVKVAPGKFPEYTAMLPDVAKLMRVRVEEGQLAWWLASRAVIPAGTSARCDYLFAYGYTGFPPEPRTRAQAETDFGKAKIEGTYAEMLARRDATSTLVSDDLWRRVPGGSAGANSEKGSYLRINLYKYKPGHTGADWAKLETEGWKPFAEAIAKDMPGFGWRAVQLSMPGGTSQQYNAMTVDIYPNWTASGKGYNIGTWSKVHPELKSEDYLNKVNDTVDRYKVELYTVADLVRPK